MIEGTEGGGWLSDADVRSERKGEELLDYSRCFWHGKLHYVRVFVCFLG